MKFNEKYPNANYLGEVYFGIVKFNGAEPCFICKELTEFGDIDFQCPICSEECLGKLLDMYNTEAQK